RVGSLTVSQPVTVHAIWEAACHSYNGGNNRGGGIDFAGFAPAAVSEKTCLMFNTIGPDRAETIREMAGHLGGCRGFDAARRQTKYQDIPEEALCRALENPGFAGCRDGGAPAGGAALEQRLAAFVADVREEYFTALSHLLDSRYYRTHSYAGQPPPPGKYASK